MTDKKEIIEEYPKCKICGEVISKWNVSGLCKICENLHPTYFRK